MSCIGNKYDISLGSKNIFNALNTSLINVCNSKIYGGRLKTKNGTRNRRNRTRNRTRNRENKINKKIEER
jgi:hypothetical protein